MTGEIRFSLALPRFVDPGQKDPYRRTYEFARHVEELGFHTGFVGHHSFTPETRDPSAPFVLLAAIAARTERLRLGTGVYLAALHHPVTVTEQVATLDQISNGRAVVGVGVGYRPYEFEGFGIDFAQRGQRLTECIEIMRSALSTGSYAYQGECFTVPDLVVEPPCVQRPHPPILVGGTSHRAIERAATVGDGWFTLPMETLPYVKALVDQYRAACRRAGRHPYICLMREGWVAPTRERVEEEWLDRALAFHKYYWEAGTRGDESDPVLQRVGAGERVGYEEFSRDRAIAGTPDFCIDEIRRWHDEIGFDELCLIFTSQRDRAGQTTMTEVVDLFGQEVIPAFRS